MFRNISSSIRLAIGVSAVFTLAACLAGVLSYVLQSQEMGERLRTDVTHSLESLLQIEGQGDLQDVRDQANAMADASKDGSVLVGYLDQDGAILAGNFAPRHLDEGARWLTPADAPAKHRDDDEPHAYWVEMAQVDSGWLVVARDNEWMVETQEILFSSMSVGLGLALLLSIGIALWIAKRTDRRIARMEQVLETVGRGDHALRIGEDGHDDLARLAGQMDATLEQLETGITAIRQVSTDVAHDLRAPLSRLRLKLEPLALDFNLSDAQRQSVGAALAELDGISATFDAILRLSRLQAGMVELCAKPVDLTALAQSLHEIFMPVAEDSGHQLVLAAFDGPVMIDADPQLIQQACVNLLENALRHSPSGTVVTLMASVQPEGAVLEVRDTGPGIPIAQRERVCERFVRLDKSRGTKGTGLGLALVTAIAQMHGARLMLRDGGPGLRATLLFPNTPKP
ncbi:hypothetical protein BFP70_13040 [Thioclava sp. SK-1]|uniref:sensor histidine kinase n=1 Tax=Thioclava sp. SK-1 TaxID=1889770 RepID=UPI000826197D|nr:HAMP domain-containing sensor histidine kinase [Thioclava sp. SK-1]OCX63129.1 hypothetical protein BFP70_13040 [Thioclava sp. SK-1]